MGLMGDASSYGSQFLCLNEQEINLFGRQKFCFMYTLEAPEGAMLNGWVNYVFILILVILIFSGIFNIFNGPKAWEG